MKHTAAINYMVAFKVAQGRRKTERQQNSDKFATGKCIVDDR